MRRSCLSQPIRLSVIRRRKRHVFLLRDRQVDHIEVTAELAARAASLAESAALRGHDAVKLAAVESIVDPDLVVVAGDVTLGLAAQALGLAFEEVS